MGKFIRSTGNYSILFNFLPGWLSPIRVKSTEPMFISCDTDITLDLLRLKVLLSI